MQKSEWAESIAKTLCTLSPTSLKVTKKAIEEGARKDLAGCLVTEYRLLWACLNKNSDFAEGMILSYIKFASSKM